MKWIERQTEYPAMPERVGRVRAKLREVRDNWRRHAQYGRIPFGAASHQYLVREALDESTISAFEAHHGIRLPSEYRGFLRYIGDGGAGPYYGLLPLARWNWAATGDEPAFPIPRRGYLSSLSPLSPYAARNDNWRDELPSHEWDPYQGSIAIVNQGGSRCARLVVSGAARGRIFNADAYEDPPCFTEDDGFLSWYERWLDDMLAGNYSPWSKPGANPCGCA
jgi:hypothetical protein